MYKGESMHNQRGYILFLLFCLLSLCMSIISIFFSKTVTYQHLMHLLTETNKARSLAINSINVAQAVLYTPLEEEKKGVPVDGKTEEKSKSPYHAFLKKIFFFLSFIKH